MINVIVNKQHNDKRFCKQTNSHKNKYDVIELKLITQGVSRSN